MVETRKEFIMLLTALLSFITGSTLTALILYLYFSNKTNTLKENYISLKSKAEISENLQEIIKRDFVQLANETIKNEQEDLRKQNRESLEEKIAPLTKELDDFIQKVELINL